MPNLTVAEALAQLVDAIESAGYEHDEAHALVAEYLAAHDAEAVKSFIRVACRCAREAFPISATDSSDDNFEALLRDALNRADQRRKET